MPQIIDNLVEHVNRAVTHYWVTRKIQRERQKSKGTSDSGDGIKGIYKEPAKDLAFSNFAGYLSSHVRTFVK